MPKTIDILTVMDPMGFPDNISTLPLGLNTPINQIPMVSIPTLNANVWMLAEQNSVRAGQGTWNLSINASANDTIRWWDTAVIQDTNEDMIIVGFNTYTNWSSVLATPKSDTKVCGISYIKSGFQFESLSNLTFTMNSFQNNFVYTQVLPNALKNTAVNYYLIVAKLDVSQVGSPPLKGLYRFDPTITIV